MMNQRKKLKVGKKERNKMLQQNTMNTQRINNKLTVKGTQKDG